MDEWDPAAGAACGIVAPAGGACEGCGGGTGGQMGCRRTRVVARKKKRTLWMSGFEMDMEEVLEVSDLDSMGEAAATVSSWNRGGGGGRRFGL